jgi:hypothetical protein
MSGCSGAAAQAEARCLCSEQVCCLKGAKGVPTHDLIILDGPIVRTLGKVYPHSLPVIQRFLTHITSRSRGWPPHQMTRFGCQMPWNGSHAEFADACQVVLKAATGASAQNTHVLSEQKAHSWSLHAELPDAYQVALARLRKLRGPVPMCS